MSAASSRKIGLALGSGAARGWAHIGVIHQLREMGVRLDIITGSSVGAVVGAALATDRLDEFEEWVSKLSRFDIVRLLDARITGGGLLRGSVLMKAIQKQIGNPDIDSLSPRFGCVATELGTGREIWLRSGPLIEACRASISLPGLFAPAAWHNQYLLDGGLVNPVPVSLARAMGADVVISVNLNGDLVEPQFWTRSEKPANKKALGAESDKDKSNGNGLSAWAAKIKAGLGVQLDAYISSLRSDETPDPGLFDVMVGAIDIMQDRITRSRMAGDPPNIHITPRLGHIGLMEFDRAGDAIPEGRKAVTRLEQEIRHLMAVLDELEPANDHAERSI